jgi:hypothetical protein
MMLTEKQELILKKHMSEEFYDRNGTGKPLKALHRVFVPGRHVHDETEDEVGLGDSGPRLIVVCLFDDKAKRRGKFEYVIFVDELLGDSHVPTEYYGLGTAKQVKFSVLEAVFYELTGQSLIAMQSAQNKAMELVRLST